MGDEIIVGYDFGFDKTSFEIIVNGAAALGAFVSRGITQALTSSSRR